MTENTHSMADALRELTQPAPNMKTKAIAKAIEMVLDLVGIGTAFMIGGWKLALGLFVWLFAHNIVGRIAITGFTSFPTPTFAGYGTTYACEDMDDCQWFIDE